MRKKAPNNSLLRKKKDVQGLSVAGTMTCLFRHAKHRAVWIWAHLHVGPSASECCSQGQTSKSPGSRSTGHTSWLQSAMIWPHAPPSPNQRARPKAGPSSGTVTEKKRQASLGLRLQSQCCDRRVTGPRHTEAEPGCLTLHLFSVLWAPSATACGWADPQHDIIHGRSPPSVAIYN